MRFGIDLGGTKTEIIALAPGGRELLRERRPTPAHDYRAIVDMLSEMVISAETKLACRGSVGIGIPGAPAPENELIKNANTVCLIGKPLARDLGAALARPVRIANDANCFTLSEAADGAGQGRRVVFGVIVGTGTGGGITVDRQILVGPNAIAGEWGHNPLPWPTDSERPGSACYCGKSGCIETFLSGPGLVRDHLASGGREKSPQDIALAAEEGDLLCEKTLARYENRLARSLASVINVLDPDAIVLGGGLSNLPRLYVNLPLLLGDFVFSNSVVTPILPARHGDSSGVRGAAWLWPELSV